MSRREPASRRARVVLCDSPFSHRAALGLEPPDGTGRRSSRRPDGASWSLYSRGHALTTYARAPLEAMTDSVH
jgi:hypothetical protein